MYTRIHLFTLHVYIYTHTYLPVCIYLSTCRPIYLLIHVHVDDQIHTPYSVLAIYSPTRSRNGANGTVQVPHTKSWSLRLRVKTGLQCLHPLPSCTPGLDPDASADSSKVPWELPTGHHQERRHWGCGPQEPRFKFVLAVLTQEYGNHSYYEEPHLDMYLGPHSCIREHT